MGLDMTQLAPSVDGGTLVLVPLDDATLRAATLQVCANALDVDDAADLLTRLGLLRPMQACGHPVDDLLVIGTPDKRKPRTRCLACKPLGHAR